MAGINCTERNGAVISTSNSVPGLRALSKPLRNTGSRKDRLRKWTFDTKTVNAVCQTLWRNYKSKVLSPRRLSGVGRRRSN